MRKFLSLLFICLLFINLISCGNTDKELGFTPPINGLYWGMTTDEVSDKLNLTKNNIINDDGKYVILSYENATILNEKANVLMFFDIGEFNLGLYRIEVKLLNLDKNNLISQLNNKYGNYTAVDDNSTPCRWESKKKIIDLPEQTQNKMRKLLVELTPVESKTFSDDTVWRNIQKQPISTVNLSNENTITYFADNIALYNIVNNNEKYNKLVEKIEKLIKLHK